MCVYSSHIKGKDGKNIVDSGLCDFYLLFKLGVGKEVRIVFAIEESAADEDDKFRAVSVAVSECQEDRKD